MSVPPFFMQVLVQKLVLDLYLLVFTCTPAGYIPLFQSVTKKPPTFAMSKVRYDESAVISEAAPRKPLALGKVHASMTLLSLMRSLTY